MPPSLMFLPIKIKRTPNGARAMNEIPNGMKSNEDKVPPNIKIAETRSGLIQSRPFFTGGNSMSFQFYFSSSCKLWLSQYGYAPQTQLLYQLTGLYPGDFQ